MVPLSPWHLCGSAPIQMLPNLHMVDSANVGQLTCGQDYTIVNFYICPSKCTQCVNITDELVVLGHRIRIDSVSKSLIEQRDFKVFMSNRDNPKFWRCFELRPKLSKDQVCTNREWGECGDGPRLSSPQIRDSLPANSSYVIHWENCKLQSSFFAESTRHSYPSPAQCRLSSRRPRLLLPPTSSSRIQPTMSCLSP